MPEKSSGLNCTDSSQLTKTKVPSLLPQWTHKIRYNFKSALLDSKGSCYNAIWFHRPENGSGSNFVMIPDFVMTCLVISDQQRKALWASQTMKWKKVEMTVSECDWHCDILQRQVKQVWKGMCAQCVQFMRQVQHSESSTGDTVH